MMGMRSGRAERWAYSGVCAALGNLSRAVALAVVNIGCREGIEVERRFAMGAVGALMGGFGVDRDARLLRAHALSGDGMAVEGVCR